MQISQSDAKLRVGAKGSVDPEVARLHSGLLDQTLPLLAKSWQQDRLEISDATERAKDRDIDRTGSPKGRKPHQIDLILRHSEENALRSVGETRFELLYNARSIASARAAVLAISAHGGMPIAGDEQSMALLTLAERIAQSDIPVLLEGPTGTGKEVLARFVHRTSSRSKGPFVAVNCAAMPEAMLEGLLFGHRKGAFTGAAEAREGLFAAANGGTLLLDEIGELPLPLQAKLLRALQEGEVLPLGATKPIKVETRIVACTNRTLAAEVEAGRFREDLLYRLNVFPLELAALRDRRGDIAPLAFGMLLRHDCGKGQPCWLTGQALALLEGHAWPGNVRELENVIRRAILLAGDESRIGSEHIVFDQPVRSARNDEFDTATTIPFAHARARGSAQLRAFGGGSQPRPQAAAQTGPKPDGKTGSLSDIAFASEAQAILDALDRCDGHRARTARSLGISERTLRYRLASMRDSGLIAAGAEA